MLRGSKFHIRFAVLRFTFVLRVSTVAESIKIKRGNIGMALKSKETRPGWGEVHNVCKACVGITEELANMCT